MGSYTKLLTALLMMLALLLAGCGSQDLHGLPSNVPLPNGATFKLMDNVGTRGSLHEWAWTLDSPNTPAPAGFQPAVQVMGRMAGAGWEVERKLPPILLTIRADM